MVLFAYSEEAVGAKAPVQAATRLVRGVKGVPVEPQAKISAFRHMPRCILRTRLVTCPFRHPGSYRLQAPVWLSIVHLSLAIGLSMRAPGGSSLPLRASGC